MTTHAAFATTRWPLVVVLGMLCAVIAWAAAVRYSGQPIRQPDAQALMLRELVFEDRPDGSIAVLDAASKKQIDAIVGEAGFARGTLRGFARERRARGIGAQPPLQLIGRSDGRLTLLDPQTGRIVDLEAFGPVNADVFGRMLRAQGNGQLVMQR